MKHLTFIAVFVFVLSSCSVKKQASTTTGRTDDVYFTVNDTRKKAEPKFSQPSQRTETSLQDNQNNSNQHPDGYTGSYANRLRFFGSVNTYYYDAYRPSIVPSVYYNYYSGWNVGLTFVNPRYGYISGFNSPFSPYYGLNMPYYDPFYASSYGGVWMSYYPRYYFNPYFYNPCYYSYGYNNYYYPYYNPYYSNFYNNNKPRPSNPAPVSRRTGSSTNIPSSTNSSTTAPQNSTQNNQNNNQNSWYNNGNNDRGGSGSSGRSGSSGSSGGNSDRGSSGSSGSTRRR